jgi:hypothetical protein
MSGDPFKILHEQKTKNKMEIVSIVHKLTQNANFEPSTRKELLQGNG